MTHNGHRPPDFLRLPVTDNVPSANVSKKCAALSPDFEVADETARFHKFSWHRDGGMADLCACTTIRAGAPDQLF